MSFPKGYENTDLLIEDILTGDVRGDVTSDRVSDSIGTPGVKLSSGISLGLRVSASSLVWAKGRTMFTAVPSQKPWIWT